MTVSEVGRIAMCSSSSVLPLETSSGLVGGLAERWVDIRFGDPGNFRSEPFNVVLLALEHLRGDKHGEVAVLHADSLDVIVEPALDLLPNRIRPRLPHQAS